FTAYPEKPIRFIGEVAEITVLPPSFAQEIRNDNRLSFTNWTFKMFHGHLSGFEPFKVATDGHDLVQTVATKDLTKHLNTITEPLAEETDLTLKELFTDSTGNPIDWHSIPMKDMILHLIARISSRVFLGTELCRDETWLRVTQNYTVLAFGNNPKRLSSPHTNMARCSCPLRDRSLCSPYRTRNRSTPGYTFIAKGWLARH
ncbi:hypothetical protein B0J13DRAFT_461677, partial [Dactylonectria estremocensis]